MARYPHALWDPLGTQTEPRMRAHDIACVHTMVGTLAGTTAMFHENGYGGTESHFGMGAEGEMRQWQDTAFEADANYDGNDRVISLETADKGAGFPAWSGSDVPAWTPQQVDAIVAWLLWVTSKEAHAGCPTTWLCHQHGIPRVLIPDTGPTRRGIAYHRQGVESYPTPYQPGWLQPGCERWSSSRGKVCPGDRRIAQLVNVIIPRVQGATAQPAPEPEEPDMLIIDCPGKPALILGVGGVKRLSTAQRNALRTAGVEAKAVDAATSDTLWSLRDPTPVVDIDETAVAAQIVVELAGTISGDIDAAAVEAVVRRVFADAGTVG